MPMLRSLVLSFAASCTALSPASRRDVLKAAPVVAAPFLAAPAVAEDFQASLKPLYKAAKTAKLTYRSKAGEPPPEAWAEDAFVGSCVEINQCVGCRGSSPRHRAGVASMAWRPTRRFRTNAP